MAEKWPDQTTRDLLAQRAVQDKDGSPRRAALQALAEKWPDQTTRDLLAQRAVQDDNEYTRRAALQALAEKWPDQTTRDLLARRAVQDDDSIPAAPRCRRWRRSGRTRPPATCSPSAPSRMTTSDTRRAALQALAEKWPDQTTRDLLAQRAVQDDRR